MFVFSLWCTEWCWKPLCEPIFLCIKNYIGTQVDDLSTWDPGGLWFILPTIQRQWFWCNSYFVWLCGLMPVIYFTTSCFILGLILLLFLMFFSTFQHCDHLAWRRESRSIWLSCMHHCFFFSSSLFSSVGCGLRMWHPLDFSFNFLTWIVCTTL